MYHSRILFWRIMMEQQTHKARYAMQHCSGYQKVARHTHAHAIQIIVRDDSMNPNPQNPTLSFQLPCTSYAWRFLTVSAWHYQQT
jgi:hypothetical protein